VHLVEGDTMTRVIECAARCSEREIAFRVVPGAGEVLYREAPLGLLLVRKSGVRSGADTRSSLVLVVATSQSEAASAGKHWGPPLEFSMSGLAG
jgi:hypothetical protein